MAATTLDDEWPMPTFQIICTFREQEAFEIDFMAAVIRCSVSLSIRPVFVGGLFKKKVFGSRQLFIQCKDVFEGLRHDRLSTLYMYLHIAHIGGSCHVGRP